MRKVLVRWQRVILRLWGPWTHLRSKGQMILKAFKVLAALGFVKVVTSDTLRPWLFSDWSHLAFVISTVLAILSLLALYEVEKESDETKSVQILVFGEPIAELRSVVSILDAELRNAVRFGVDIRFRNDGEATVTVFFPTLELFRRHDADHWNVLAFKNADSPIIRSHPRGLEHQQTLWLGRHEILAGDEVIAHLEMFGTGPVEDGASAFVKRDLKLRMTFDILGHPTLSREVLFPPIQAPI